MPGSTAPATASPPAATTLPATSSADTSTTIPDVATSPPPTIPSGTVTPVKPGYLIAADRCAANKAAGPITFLTGLDFAASAGTIEVLTAKEKNYYERMCLDVEITSGKSSSNYQTVAQNAAQFAAADTFSELMANAASTQSDFVVLTEDGTSPLDTLIVRDDAAPTIADLRGQTIGVSGTMPTAVQTMLADNGLIAGTDYQIAEIAQTYGLDPTVQITIPTIVAFTGSKAVQPGILNRAVVRFHTFDPASANVPGNFGLIYTNRAFATEFPTAVQDFVRATIKGLDDALDNPGAASANAFEMATAAGNPAGLTLDGENYRWKTESDLMKASVAPGHPPAVPDVSGLQAAIDSDAVLGRFGATKPTLDTHVDVTTIASIYNPDGTVIWP